MMSTDKQEKQKEAIVGRWTIGETLDVDTYSWMTKGQDIKTGKFVALKFMEKSAISWDKQQTKTIETEIETLKNVRHKNVIKLYAYNLNSKYPLSSQDNISYIDTILMVLEYVPHSELFDVLYYTSALKEIVTRTFFKQIVYGLEACHNAQIVHKNITPISLALDRKYNIKITDFGTSIQLNDDKILDTAYMKYRAPELWLKQQYDAKSDIFSVGVILFILLAGYPPFEQSSNKDKWYKPLIKGKVEKFWKAHQKSPIAKIPEAKDLLTQMLCFDPKQRVDVNGVKSHKWFMGKTLKQKALRCEIRDRHRKAEKKRLLETRNIDKFAASDAAKPIPGIEKTALKLYPDDDGEEEMFGEAYTYLGGEGMRWYDLYNLFEEAVTGDGQGNVSFDFDKGILNCEMNVAKGNDQENVKFNVEIFESRIWKNKYKSGLDPDLIVLENEHQVFVVRFTRTQGDTLVFNKLKNGFILTYCSSIIKGLPKWARNHDVDTDDDVKDNDSDEKDDDSDGDDDYDKEIGDIFDEQNKGGIQVDIKT